MTITASYLISKEKNQLNLYSEASTHTHTNSFNYISRLHLSVYFQVCDSHSVTVPFQAKKKKRTNGVAQVATAAWLAYATHTGQQSVKEIYLYTSICVCPVHGVFQPTLVGAPPVAWRHTHQHFSPSFVTSSSLIGFWFAHVCLTTTSHNLSRKIRKKTLNPEKLCGDLLQK
jgi:hypothetical protein